MALKLNDWLKDTDGKYRHVITTSDGEVYVDGVLVSEKKHYEGTMKGIHFSTKALSEEEIQQLYQKSK